MTILARFRVATRATGHRRTIDVVVYLDLEHLQRDASAYSPGYDPDLRVSGVFQSRDYTWPEPSGAFFGIIRLLLDKVDNEVVAHECAHAAAEMTFADTLPGWDARARTHLRGDNEPFAYAVGHLNSDIWRQLRRRFDVNEKGR